MDDGLKQRLIGAIVLLALGVIFLPVLFDRDPIKPVDQTTAIPPKPERITITISEPEPVEDIDLAPEPEDMFIPDESEVVDLTPEPVSLSDQGTPKSWVLQVASFSEKERADTFRDTLLSKNYPAYNRSVGGNTRVYIGPKLDKSALVKLKNEVDETFNISSILLEFKPK